MFTFRLSWWLIFIPIVMQLSPDLMPDALHPNAAGMALLAECILPYVKLYGKVDRLAKEVSFERSL